MEEEIKLVEGRSISLSLIIIQMGQLPLEDNSSLLQQVADYQIEMNSPLSRFKLGRSAQNRHQDEVFRYSN